MTRQELAAYLTETYNTTGEHLFTRYPNFLVFRHSGKKKWFAVIMDIPRKNLALTGDGDISVMNLKCDTRLIGSFRTEPGIYPGWHMNKAHWLTVALDGTVEDEKIRFLVDMSYELTKNEEVVFSRFLFFMFVYSINWNTITARKCINDLKYEILESIHISLRLKQKSPDFSVETTFTFMSHFSLSGGFSLATSTHTA